MKPAVHIFRAIYLLIQSAHKRILNVYCMLDMFPGLVDSGGEEKVKVPALLDFTFPVQLRGK